MEAPQQERKMRKMKKCTSLLLVLVLTLVPALLFTAHAADDLPGAATVQTQSGNLYVRSSPGGSVITSLAKGSYVTTLSLSNGWRKIQYAKDKYGYCSDKYLQAVTTAQNATVTLTSGWLNVRSGAGASYAVVQTLVNQTEVIVLSESNGWSKILYDGTAIGYASSRYLVKVESARAASYSAISLKVPSYKQTDTRWANAKIGSTSYTIGAIGCTTTALAMTESFRTGKTVYPDAMAKTLKYSDTGSLYWPSNYVFLTQPDRWMERIYDLLKQGKPVIVGAKKSNGAQHWIVVTGCYSVTTLSAAAFKINDPGSNARTSLGQFFAVYPNLYKLVWYTE